LAILARSGPHSKVVRALVEAHAELLDAPGSGKETALHMASHKGDLEIVNFLLNKGADISAQCNFGYTPIHLAVDSRKSRNLSVIQELVRRGAHILHVTDDDITPFDFAARTDERAPILDVLLQKYTKMVFDREGGFALHAVIRQANFTAQTDGRVLMTEITKNPLEWNSC